MRNLASLLRDEKFDFVIPIARGGWLPALIVSQQNKVRGIFSFGAYGYEDETNQMLPQLLIYQIPPIEMLRGKKVLVVDDIVDTGRTMAAITDWLKKRRVKYKTATVYKKKGSKFEPDYYVSENTSWVRFPYEI